MKFRIEKCSNSILWYNKHVGEEFESIYEEESSYWTREREVPYCINWVYKKDLKVVEDNFTKEKN